MQCFISSAACFYVAVYFSYQITLLLVVKIAAVFYCEWVVTFVFMLLLLTVCTVHLSVYNLPVSYQLWPSRRSPSAQRVM